MVLRLLRGVHQIPDEDFACIFPPVPDERRQITGKYDLQLLLLKSRTLQKFIN